MPYIFKRDSIGCYLWTHGLVMDPTVEVENLDGGVSSNIALVHSRGVDLIVKQALSRLRVAEVWEAAPDRGLTEARALQLARSIRPDGVPEVIAVVPEDRLVVMTRAPETFFVWKQHLLDGEVDHRIARQVGSLLASWHSATFGDDALEEQFGALDAFVQLRVDPYHRTIMRRYPQLAGRIGVLADSLLGRQLCLVHGDLSPKNVLSDGQSSWVIDWEVAHFGDPIFDLAFLLCHLRCKAAFRPELADVYRRCFDEFLAQYAAEASNVLATIDEQCLVAHAASLALARIDGKSPVEYLDEPQRADCRRFAREVLADDSARFDAFWES